MILTLICLLSLSCFIKPGTPAQTDFPDCLDNTDRLAGTPHNREKAHFTIELPPHWQVTTQFSNGLTGSDTLAPLEDYALVGVTEHLKAGADLDAEFEQLANMLDSNELFHLLGRGETTLSDYPARWLLVEDLERRELLGPHALITYFIELPDTPYFYIIDNEAYGEDWQEDLCELKQISNTFRFRK